MTASFFSSRTDVNTQARALPARRPRHAATGLPERRRERPVESSARWACNHSSAAWSVWSLACSPVARARTSARSSSAAGSCGRWTTSARSTSRAGASSPTTSACSSATKDFDGFAEIADVLQTELVEAAREYARSEGYHFMGPVKVELSSTRSRSRALRRRSPTLRQADDAAPKHSTLVLPSGQRIAAQRRHGHRRVACPSARRAQRPERQPAPRRDPPEPPALRRGRPRIDQRHDGERHDASTARPC